MLPLELWLLKYSRTPDQVIHCLDLESETSSADHLECIQSQDRILCPIWRFETIVCPRVCLMVNRQQFWICCQSHRGIMDWSFLLVHPTLKVPVGSGQEKIQQTFQDVLLDPTWVFSFHLKIRPPEDTLDNPTHALFASCHLRIWCVTRLHSATRLCLKQEGC